MDVIKQWAFSFCAAMAACAMLRLLMPKGNMGRIYSLTLSAFILCAILSPFFLQRPELSLQIQASPDYGMAGRAERLTQVVEAQSDNAARAEIEKIVLSKLAEMGINHRSLTIHMNGKGQNDNAAQVAAEIVLDASLTNERARIKSELTEGLGFPVAIAFEGE